MYTIYSTVLEEVVVKISIYSTTLIDSNKRDKYTGRLQPNNIYIYI